LHLRSEPDKYCHSLTNSRRTLCAVASCLNTEGTRLSPTLHVENRSSFAGCRLSRPLSVISSAVNFRRGLPLVESAGIDFARF
jgi:hypothetical protein